MLKVDEQIEAAISDTDILIDCIDERIYLC